jgi:ABC-2 type transport system ATP-binding protein
MTLETPTPVTLQPTSAATGGAAPTIEARGVSKRFGKTIALDGLDLVAEPGQVVAVLGPNGAGKTTFVRALATLLTPDGGSLRVAGVDVVKNPAAVRRVIGLAGQYAAVEPAMTGRENLEMVGRLFGLDRPAARAEAARVLERFGLAVDADRLVRTYSGGMRRKLDLGASLVGAPRLLLLDEPTTGLDPRSRIELWAHIRSLVAGGTDVLLTTQYLDEADHLAGQVVIIDHGRAVAAGTPAELKQRVGNGVLEVNVLDRDDLPRLAAALGRLGAIDAVIDESSMRVSVSLPGSTETRLAGLRALVNLGIELGDVSLRRPTLDEVFLALTGHPALSADAKEKR